MGDQAALSIGEVINLLKNDFPDVSVSKVRFLEDQGLIHPPRATSGYRQFFAQDVKRLRYILQQQRDHFLPLKVIKAKLTDWERGEELDLRADEPEERYLNATDVTHDRQTVQQRAGLTSKELDQLLDHGVLRPARDGTFDGDALVVAKEARILIDHGLEPRHLRILRHSADREADLLRQLTAALRRSHSPESRRTAREVLAATAQSFESVHLRLLRQELRAILDE